MKVIEQGAINDYLTLPKLDIVDYGRPSIFGSAAKAIDAINKHVVYGFDYVVAEDNLFAYPEQSGFPGWEHAGSHEAMGKAYWNMFRARFPGGILKFHDSPDISGAIHFEGFESGFFGDIGKVGPMAFLESVMSLQPGDLWISIFGNRQVALSATVNAYVIQRFRAYEIDNPKTSLDAFLSTIGYQTSFTLTESVAWLVEQHIWSQEKATAYLQLSGGGAKPFQLRLFE